MVACIVGSHLQLNEELSLAESDGHFRGVLGPFCFLSHECDGSVASEIDPECK